MNPRGASADSLAGLTDELVGALSEGVDAARIGDDLFAVSLLLRSDAALRRVVTDVSVPAEAKQSLVRDLLRGRSTEQAVDLTASAAGKRWTVSRDLPDSLERLSEIAIVRSTGDDSGRLGDELFEVGQLVKDNPQLRDALGDPSRSVEDKVTLVESILGGKALPATVTLAKQALAGSYRTVGVALGEYQKVAAEVRDERVARVRVAKPLSEQDRRRLTDALARQYGRDVHVNVVVDPDLIGGIRVEIGDDVIDGTMANRLDEARRRLAG